MKPSSGGLSHGQRFRRRALRRGYKVDEVDAFLDRVEATLAGEPSGAPVTAQEVHDVVFRVRFGGYDEWQVDLHLDRVERQLAEVEERGAVFAHGPEPRLASPAERMIRPEDRMPPPPAPMPARPAPSGGPAGAPDGGFGRFEEPAPAGFEGFDPARHGKMDMTAEINRVTDAPPPMPAHGGPAGPGAGGPGPGSPSPGGHGPGMPGAPGHGAPGHGGPGHGAGGPGPAGPGRGGPGGSGPGGPAAPAPHFGPPVPAPPPPMMGNGPGGPGGPGMAPPGDVQRVDQLRRTFQPRRFGSGYDQGQVDRLFENVMAGMSGQGSPVNEAELDPSQFDLVSGGYFEAEVEVALREVREILRGH